MSTIHGRIRETYLLKPKNPTKSRNKPGNAETAKRGAVANSQGAPNGVKPFRVCIRRGDPGHLLKDSPPPYRAVPDPKFPSNFTKPPGRIVKSPKPTVHFAENPPVGSDAPKVYESDSPDKIDESGGGNPECEEDGVEQEMYKLWPEYYKAQLNTIRMVTTVGNYDAEVAKTINGREMARDSPVILVDSGASRSACGRKWIDWRFESSKPVLAKSRKLFRFGAGAAMQSLGMATIFTHVSPKATDKNSPVILPIRVDVVNSDVSMSISHESLRMVKCPIGFSSSTLAIPLAAEIKLRNTKTGHLMIQGRRPNDKTPNELSMKNHSVYAMEMELPARLLSEEEITQIHFQLGHCSENTLMSTSRAAQMNCDLPAIQKVLGKCKCQTAVQRSRPPPVASWMAKSNGEIISLDVISPFDDCFGETVAME